MPKTLINAGHRVGIDNGGGHNGQTEAKTNVNVATRAAENLRKENHEVITTHDHPKAKLLKATDLRVWAEKQKPKYCISVHQNDAENEEAEGIEVLWDGKDLVAKKIAEEIQKELVKLGGKDRGIKARPDLAILKIKGCHCVLVEGAFMTKKDNHRIDTLTEQWQQADAITTGFLNAVGR